MTRKVFVYDEDPRGLKHGLWLLGRHGVGLPGSGLELVEPKRDRTGLPQASNRNALLDAIAKEAEACIALVDLQADERLGDNYSGYRIIETIRRHPRLSRVCRPLAFTVHDRDDVVELARAHGAYGVVRRIGLEVPPEEHERIRLVGRLARLLEMPAVPAVTGGPFFLIPSHGAPPATLGDTELNVAILRVLQYRIDEDLSAFWDYIRYYAEQVDPTSIKRWVAADRGLEERIVDREMTKLGEAAQPRYRSHGLDLTALARDLLSELPQRRRAPDSQTNRRLLHRLGEVEALVGNRGVREASYVDAEALEAVREAIAWVEHDRRPHPRRGQSWYADQVERAIQELARPEDRAQFEAALVRGVNALVDAHIAAANRRSVD